MSLASLLFRHTGAHSQPPGEPRQPDTFDAATLTSSRVRGDRDRVDLPIYTERASETGLSPHGESQRHLGCANYVHGLFEEELLRTSSKQTTLNYPKPVIKMSFVVWWLFWTRLNREKVQLSV